MEFLYLIEQGLLFLGSSLTNDLSGNTQIRIGKDMSAGRHQTASADEGACGNQGSFKNNSADSNQGS